MDKITLKRNNNNEVSPVWNSFILPLFLYKKMIYFIICTSLIVALVYCFISPNRYSTVATILPTNNSDQKLSLGALAGGALSDLGLGSMMTATETSPALYTHILKSRLVSDKILDKKYNFSYKNKDKSLKLKQYFEIENHDYVLKELSGITNFDLDRNTGIISLTVTTKYPELSKVIVDSYIDELNNYVMHTKQSKAQDNEKFIAKRLTEVEKELYEVQNNLLLFRTKNMNFLVAADPTLMKELDNLERNVLIQETILLTLTKKHELAKIEVAKDIPIIQVLDQGSIPLIKSAPSRSIIMFSTLFGSVFFSILLCLSLDLMRKKHFSKNLENIIVSPEVEVNHLEGFVLKKTSRIIEILEKQEKIFQ